MANTSERVKLTKTIADRADPVIINGKVRQKLYLDTEIKGFALCVGSQSKTFLVQRDISGKTIRFTIGRYGVFTVEQARQEARQKLAQMARGENPIEEKRKKQAKGFTLAQAWELEETTLKNAKRSKKTIGRYKHTVEKYLEEWLSKPLAEISRADVRLKHNQIVDDVMAEKYSKVSNRPNVLGFNTANDVMRVFRAIWNRARREHPELPESPTINVDWFKLNPPRSALTPETLRLWYQAVIKGEQSVRRDALLLMLFSGLRRTNACEVEWKDVDFENRSLHIPKPKGGSSFTLPLSDYLIELLEQRKKENPDYILENIKSIKNENIERFQHWVFPAGSKSGHLEETRPEVALEKTLDDAGVDWSPHDLRRTFITVAEGLDISHYALKALVNHSQPNSDVTAGYLSMGVERLRAPMQAITNKLLAICKEPPKSEKSGVVVSIRSGKEK